MVLLHNLICNLLCSFMVLVVEQYIVCILHLGVAWGFILVNSCKLLDFVNCNSSRVWELSPLS